MLTNVGLEGCVARDENDYIRTAAALATDHARLEGIRNRLRARMLSSPLTNAERLTRFLEDAYAKMWEDYRQASTGGGT